MKRIKIIRIIARLNIGGPAIHTTLLTKGLDAKRFESILVSGRPEPNEGDMSYLAKEMGLKTRFISGLRRSIGLRDIKAFWQIFNYIRREKPDIVHTHTAKAGTLGRIAAILAGVPIKVHTFHGHTFHNYFGAKVTSLFLFVERILARFTDKTITLSKGQFEEICYKFNVTSPYKTSIIPLGFDLKPFLECETKKGFLRARLGIKKEERLVGIIGRPVPVKNHALFLHAARRILDRKKNVRFLMVGGERLPENMKVLCEELKLGDRLIFLGWERDMSVIYADLDVVGLTSLNEGTPVSLIEAMASAKAIVATDVGGVKDIVRHGVRGYLVPSQDTAAFADATIELLNNGHLAREFGSNGREFAKKNFSKERLEEDTEHLYQKLVMSKL